MSVSFLNTNSNQSLNQTQVEVTLEMKQKYLLRRKAELQRLISDLQENKNNLSDIQRFAHQIKGNGVTFGFAIVSEFGIRLEREVKDNDLTAVESTLKSLAHFISDSLVA